MSPSPTAPDRPAPTLPDSGRSAGGAGGPPTEVVARVLELTRGTAPALQAIVDLVRVALATAACAVAWPRVQPLIDAALSKALPDSTRAIVTSALLVLASALVAIVFFRATSRRFARPMRARLR